MPFLAGLFCWAVRRHRFQMCSELMKRIESESWKKKEVSFVYFLPLDFPPLITYIHGRRIKGDREKTKLMNHHIESDLIYFLFFEPLICFDPFSSSMKAAFYFNLFAFIFSSAAASCAFSSSDESILAEQDQFNTPARAKKVGSSAIGTWRIP